MLSYKNTGIQKFIFDRICKIDEEIVDVDPEYKELCARPAELLKLAAEKLSSEDSELLREYDDIYFGQILRRDELLYTEGLMDGMMLGYWTALVGRGVEKIKV